MLQYVSQMFLTETTLKAANAILVDYHHRLALSSIYGAGIASSSDGQRFGIQASSLLASFYPRYFGYYERAITIYTHTSDQYSVFRTRVISCSPRGHCMCSTGCWRTIRSCVHGSTTPTHMGSPSNYSVCAFCWAIRLCPGCAIWRTNNSTKLIARYRWDASSRYFTPGSIWI